MAKTLENLRDHVRMFLDEATASDWSDDNVDTEINNGYQEVVTVVMETYEDFYMTNTTFNTVADKQEYSSSDGVPTNVFKIRRIEVNYDTSASTTNYNRAEYARFDEIMRDVANSTGITPFSRPTYYVHGHGNDLTIGFIPIPTNDGTDAVKLWHIPVVSDLSSSSDAVDIPYPDRYWKAIGWYAAGVLLSKGQQEEAVGSKYLTRFEQEMNKMKMQLEDRVADGAKHVIDTQMQDVDFTHFGGF